VSHSYGLALFAVSYGRELGIDVERIRADMASEQVAERFFSARELAALAIEGHCWSLKRWPGA
jgi:phosphopantetheinyl transferase